MKIRPRDSNILIKILPREERTPGGLLIPETAQRSTCKGEVIAIGPGVNRDDNGNIIPIDMTPGQTVLFQEPISSSRVEVEINGIRHLILPAYEIVATVES